MLAAQDLKGLYAIIPTPATSNANRLDAKNTVDIPETERLINALIKDGASGLIALGTTGECATLSREDYNVFVDCVLQTVNRRIPTFIGTTALGGHEIANRITYVRDRGADGILLGIPMWQAAVTEEAVDFYRQVSECFPDIAVMVYANARAFRYRFPAEFWSAISKQAPTVCAAKYSRPAQLAEFNKAAGGRINFVPNDTSVHKFYEISPETTTACWATAAAMGPEPAKAIIDAILQRNSAAISTLADAIAWANEPIKHITNDPEIFGSYNIQIEKLRINAAGYCQSGPMRPPYDFAPKDYAAAAAECGRRWAALRKSYLGDFKFKEMIWEAPAHA
jgi:dihydrodipicolinate synthase/N-acetylneuraminate lyase